VMRNHNGLLGRYDGADGMKTGFICSGGFNIVASASRNGRRLITVVMGERKARERDLKAADLFDQGFSALGWTAQTVESLPPSSVTSPPNMRPVVCGGGRPPAEEEGQTVASGNAENPVVSLLAPTAMSFASAGAAPTRRTLGPRAPFEPIPVWIGATPGTAVAEEETTSVRKPRASRMSARPVRVKSLSRTAAASIPPAARAFVQNRPKSIIDEGKVETVKAKPQPVRQAAIKAAMNPKPALGGKKAGPSVAQAKKPGAPAKPPAKAKAAE